MGTTIKATMINADVLKKATNPIILCSYSNRLAKLVEDNKYIPFDLNIKLSEVLLTLPKVQRSKKANDEIMKIISECHQPTFFDNYEILFDPSYNIDVIKVFTELARRQKVIVKWCGGLNGSSLEYATPEYRDYRSFRIQDYDITCVL